METLELELKVLIIETLKLEEVRPEDIDPSAPLFSEGLGLDSIDALELGVALQKKYGLRFDSNVEETRQHFSSIRSLALFVSQKKAS